MKEKHVIKIDRRGAVQILAVALALSTVAPSAIAQTYPTKPIRIVVAYPAGGLADRLARFIANGLSQRLGQTAVVENRPGGNTVPATDYVAKAPPDGYTLYVNTPSSWSINAAYYKSLPYGRNDYTAIAVTNEIPMGLMVAADSPIKTLQDLIAFSKANPDKVSNGSPGALTPGQLAMEILKAGTGAQIINAPYQGSAPAIAALLGGHVSVVLTDVGTGVQHIQAGKILMLFVSTDKRLAAFPNVSTLAEAGFPNVKMISPWHGVFGPPGMPRDLVDRLNAEITGIMRSAEGQRFMADASVLHTSYSAQVAQSMVQTDYDVYAPLLARLGLKSTD